MTATESRPLSTQLLDENENGHRQPPQDVQAERAVLGACLLNPAVISDVAQILTPGDFYRPAHEAIWAELIKRHDGDLPLDVLSVAQALYTERSVASAGGPVYLSDLAADPNVLPSQATWHARAVTARADERRRVELGTWLVQAGHSGLDRDDVDTRLVEHLATRGPGEQGPASSWAPVDLAQILAGDAPDDRPTLMPRSDGPCLIYPRTVNTLSGEPTSGKTWLALHAARLELAAGHPVAYVDFEDRASRVVDRLLTIGAHPDHIAARFRYVRPDVALDTPGRTALSAAVTGTTLVVIDGVTEAMTLHGLDLSSNPDIATFYALLPRWVANHGTTVLMIDHVVKDPERQGRWAIGGQHKVAGMDGAAYTVKCVVPFGRGRKGTAQVIIAKDREGHVEEIALGRTAAEFHLDATGPVTTAALDPPQAMPTSESGELRPTHLMDKVSRYLEVHPGATISQVSEARLGKAAYVRLALQQLVAEGYVDTQPGPRNAVHHHVADPFRDGGEDPE